MRRASSTRPAESRARPFPTVSFPFADDEREVVFAGYKNAIIIFFKICAKKFKNNLATGKKCVYIPFHAKHNYFPQQQLVVADPLIRSLVFVFA
jgi:hypothetical protein